MFYFLKPSVLTFPDALQSSESATQLSRHEENTAEQQQPQQQLTSLHSIDDDEIPVERIIGTSSRSAGAMTMPARRGHNMPMSSVHSKTRSRQSIFIFDESTKRCNKTMRCPQ